MEILQDMFCTKKILIGVLDEAVKGKMKTQHAPRQHFRLSDFTSINHKSKLIGALQCTTALYNSTSEIVILI